MGNSVYWSICISYLCANQVENNLNNSKKIDYKEILNDSEFQKFSQLRKIRKQIADDDAVPAFAVFTDFELSKIARADSVTVATLGKIKGVGAKKIEKYGRKMCEIFSNIGRSEEGIEVN